MKVSDAIVEFLIEKKITDVFGYPGGAVTHLMDSFARYQDQIQAHVTYHEQAAAFCACGYAQASNLVGVAYATSGPGATNLITGICNAYFDSIPTVFITGQVNTFESKQGLSLRQKGFQETDIISMVRHVTKYCSYVDSPDDVRFCLEKAWYLAQEGRPGPVLLDIPMNVQRSEVLWDSLRRFAPAPSYKQTNLSPVMEQLNGLLSKAKRPCLLLGAGVKTSGCIELCRKLCEWLAWPIVTSMPAIDVVEHTANYFGFVGAYGHRYANFIVAKSDFVLVIGSRLDIRQVGASSAHFAEQAKLVRVDVDPEELANKIKQDEWGICANLKDFISAWLLSVPSLHAYSENWQAWRSVCCEIKNTLENLDQENPNRLMAALSRCIPDHAIVTTDVGQNQVWAAQSFEVKAKQQVLFSSGHGAMGYSLPAAIGAYYSHKGTVFSINGDGGIQMNIQELQFISREQLPIKVIIFNNSSLGMIRHFQEMYFEGNYTQTVEGKGYSAPDFQKIAGAYQLPYYRVTNCDEIQKHMLEEPGPAILEVVLSCSTYVYPKLEYGKPNQDQEPPIDRELYQGLMDL